MSYSKNNSLSDNLEVDLLRHMIVVATVIFCFLSIDGNPYLDGFSLWMYFISLAPCIYLFTLPIKAYPKLSLFLLASFLVTISIILRQHLFYNGLEFRVDRIIFVSLHFMVMAFFFFNAIRTLVLKDVKADISMFNKTSGLASAYRKLIRRKNRRAYFRAKNTTNFRLGKPRA